MAPLKPGTEESKAEHMAHIVHPFEMEEGRAEVLKAEQRSDRQNHCSKFACCWVFLSLVLVLGVLTAVFYPKKPHVSLFSTSLLEIDGFTGKCRSGGRRCRPCCGVGPAQPLLIWYCFPLDVTKEIVCCRL